MIPVGLAAGSQLNLLLTTDRMLQLVDNEPRRIIPVHEERLVDEFPSRITGEGLHVVEIAVGAGEKSYAAEKKTHVR